MVKSGIMRWAGDVARMGQIINAYNIFIGKPEDLGVDGMIILE